MHTLAFYFFTFLGSKQRYTVKINPRPVSVPTNSLSSTLPNAYHLPIIVKMLRANLNFLRIKNSYCNVLQMFKNWYLYIHRPLDALVPMLYSARLALRYGL